jgi:hypothetical protein
MCVPKFGWNSANYRVCYCGKFIVNEFKEVNCLSNEYEFQKWLEAIADQMTNGSIPEPELNIGELQEEMLPIDAPLCEPPPERAPFDFSEPPTPKPKWRKLANGVRHCAFIWFDGRFIFKK